MIIKIYPYFTLAFFALTAISCGQYIEYDGEPPEIKSAILNDFPEVENLNHYALGALVAQYAKPDEQNEHILVDYKGWASDKEALYQLDQYLGTLGAVDPAKLNGHHARFAYWLNAYNAAVVRGILRDFFGDENFSVTDDDSFFNLAYFIFGDVKLSLYQIEHGVIRGKFEDELVAQADAAALEKIKLWHAQLWEGASFDARFHAALNCGALGCPNLWIATPFVYRSDILDEQLTQATEAWLKSADKGAGEDGVSMLFNWYEDDFVAHMGSVRAFIDTYRQDDGKSIAYERYIKYDWALNIQ